MGRCHQLERIRARCKLQPAVLQLQAHHTPARDGKGAAFIIRDIDDGMLSVICREMLTGMATMADMRISLPGQDAS
jgi:hypothetical protein